MSEKLPISVHILTLNSADTVEKALQSAEGCAEILVIDGGSTDGTLEIAQKYGATVLPQGPESTQGKRIEDFSAVRNIALRASTQPWVLALDSDEYLSQEILSELPKVVSGSPAAYYVPRKYVLADGRVVDYATTYPNERLYLFHRDAVQQWIKPVHERPQVREGMPTKRLKGASLAPLSPIEEYKEKNLRYLQIEVKKSAGKGWGNWFIHRVLHTLRSRLIALIRLSLIWLVPRKGVRLPLRQELLRFWYGWKLICATCPLNKKK
jgi:glycosyltransferase involved in cell wall biosynthesis